MKQEFVTRRQLQLYNQAIEREREIDRISFTKDKQF